MKIISIILVVISMLSGCCCRDKGRVDSFNEITKGLSRPDVEKVLNANGFEYSYDSSLKVIHAILRGKHDLVGVNKSLVLEIGFGEDGLTNNVKRSYVYTGP